MPRALRAPVAGQAAILVVGSLCAVLVGAFALGALARGLDLRSEAQRAADLAAVAGARAMLDAYPLLFDSGPAGLPKAEYDEGGRIRILDLASGRTQPLPGRQQGVVLSAAFSPDGRTLATGAEGGDVTVWNLEESRQFGTLRGHTDDAIEVRFSPDGSTLYTAGVEGDAIAWDTSGDRCLGARFPTSLVAIPQDRFPPAFSIRPDGREIAVARLDGSVDLIDAQTLRTRRTFRAFGRARALPPPRPPHLLATAIDYSPNGTQLAGAGERGLLAVFDAHTGTRVGPLLNAPRGGCVEPASVADRCYEELIQTLAFADRGRLATASIGGQVWTYGICSGAGPSARFVCRAP